MVNQLPKQPQSTDKYENFSSAVVRHMKEKRMTQSDLVKSSALSKTTISRICRNNNDKGSSYLPTPAVVMAVSVGLKLSCDEAKALLFAAIPEMAYWSGFLERSLTIDEANESLYDNGLPLLGNNIE